MRFSPRVGPWRYRSVIKIDRGDGVTSWAVRQLYALLAEPHESMPDAREWRAAAMLDLMQSMLRLRDGDASPTKSTVHTLSRAIRKACSASA